MIYDGQKYNRKLGKGFGWYQQVDTLLKHPKNAKKTNYFVLVTGRYKIKNIIKILLNANTPFICNINKNLN